MSAEHVTRDGTRMLISEMSDSHLRNTINLWERKAAEGIEVIDGGGFDLEDIWFDTVTLYGQAALKRLNHAAYVAEMDARAAR